MILSVTPLPVSAQEAPLGAFQPSVGEERVHVMIQMAAAPAAAVYAEEQVSAAQAIAAAQAQVASISQEQDVVAAQMAQLGADELYRLQRVYNGVAAIVDATAIDALLALPGVVAIHPLAQAFPDHTRSLPFLGVPEVWGASTLPADGQGVTVAIVDTGIDYQHATFGGSRLYTANDPTVIGDVSDFPGTVVIGGYDFAGDDYDPTSAGDDYSPVPDPDLDPTDCQGHGTHVAATVAGRGVERGTPTTYPGPYDRTTFTTDFEVGPGVAPAANLIALKIFGCQGGTELTELALEWAVDPNGDGDFTDHVDVVNLSLGSAFGSIYDSMAVASDNAARLGVIVVASAGNSGDGAFSTSTPSIADQVISVAATSDHLTFAPVEISRTSVAVEVDASAAYYSSRGPRRVDTVLKPDITAPGTSIESAKAGPPGTTGTIKSGTSMSAPHVAGSMALLRQLYPTWRVAELKALAMNTAAIQGQQMTAMPNVTRTGSGQIDPVNMFNSQVIAYNGDVPGLVSISFGAPLVVGSRTDAKGLAIHNKGSADIDYQITYLSVLDTPGVAFSVGRDQVSIPAHESATIPVFMTATAADMRHTRAADLSASDTIARSWLTEEAGHLMLWPSSGSFKSRIEIAAPAATEAGVTISATFAYAPESNQLTYSIDLPGLPVVDVAAIQIVGDPAAKEPEIISEIDLLTSGLDPALPITGTVVLDASHAALLASRALYLRAVRPVAGADQLVDRIEPSPAVLHVPVYAAPRPAAEMRAAQPSLALPSDERIPLVVDLVGNDLPSVDPPNTYGSLISAFELQLSSMNKPPLFFGRQFVDIADHADLQYVGITDDLETTGEGRIDLSTLYFGIATHGDWSTPNEVEFWILIDTDEDDSFDYALFNADAALLAGAFSGGDAFASVLYDIRTDSVISIEPLNHLPADVVETGLFFTNVIVLSVPAGQIGLSSGNPGFRYLIQSYSRYSPLPIDMTPLLTYAPQMKSMDLFSRNEDAPIFNALDGNTIELTVDRQNFLASGGRNLLLLHHHNPVGLRAEVVQLHVEWPEARFLPSVTAE